MRVPMCLLLLLFIASAAPAPDPLADLHEATYVTVRGIKAELPSGSLTVQSGVVAIFNRPELRTGGLAIGDISMTYQLPKTSEGVLDLFREMDPKLEILDWKLSAAYLNAAVGSEAALRPEGIPLNIRTWDKLDEAEQKQFESYYLQAAGDSFPAMERPMGRPGGMGAPAFRLRDPVEKEVFAAVWMVPTKDEPDGKRYDFRVSADGMEHTVTDSARGMEMLRRPWAPEKGDIDKAVVFKAIEYHYSFTPPSGEGETRKLGVLHAAITARFSVKEARQQVELISYPWLKINSISRGEGKLGFERGGPGVSNWILRVEGAFTPGQDYTLLIDGEGESPDSFDAIGYGGVYRFGTSALYPGEANPVDVGITVDPLPGDAQYVASGGAPISGAGGGYSAKWSGLTRGQMLAATAFTPVDVTTNWGNLRVFAPEALRAGVPQMESVTSVGEMLDYYTSLWGAATPLWAALPRTQYVFLLPDEGGVQAFEDAGFVFILGTGGSYGAGAMGLPLVAHEVAHIWWGQGFSAPRWFTEGMANYSASKFIEDYKTRHGEPDPVSYRRYIVNFALGSELPLSMLRRDELDDSAAIYHNSAGFLLTCDHRLPYGLDGVLKRFYEAGLDAPSVSHEELRGMFGDANEEILPALWDKYIEQGGIDRGSVEDDTYRELTMTPGRENYVRLLSWLTPTRRKAAMGDVLGALYCANRALEFRAEPKDYLFIADLTLKAGKVDEAIERCTALAEREDLDPQTKVKINYLLAQAYKTRGDTVNEQAALEVVVRDGPGAGLISEVQAAQARLDELK